LRACAAGTAAVKEAAMKVLRFLLGLVIGAGVALLFAPKSGRELRQQLVGGAAGTLLEAAPDDYPQPEPAGDWAGPASVVAEAPVEIEEEPIAAAEPVVETPSWETPPEAPAGDDLRERIDETRAAVESELAEPFADDVAEAAVEEAVVSEEVAEEAIVEAAVSEIVAEEAVEEAVVSEEVAEEAAVEAAAAALVAEAAAAEAEVAEEVAVEAVVEAAAAEIVAEESVAEEAVEEAVVSEEVAEEAVAEALVAEEVAEEAAVEAAAAALVVEAAAVEAEVAEEVAVEAVVEAAAAEIVAEESVAEAIVDEVVAEEAVVEAAVDEAVAEEAVVEAAVDEAVAEEAVVEAAVEEVVAEEAAPKEPSPREGGGIDQAEMRRRIEETRARLKAKAFDAMMSGEAALLSRDSGEKPVPTADDAGLELDAETDNVIDESLSQEDY